MREVFDLDRGETEEFSVALIRKLPRWFVGLTFDLDEVKDDFSVSLSPAKRRKQLAKRSASRAAAAGSSAPPRRDAV